MCEPVQATAQLKSLVFDSPRLADSLRLHPTLAISHARFFSRFTNVSGLRFGRLFVSPPSDQTVGNKGGPNSTSISVTALDDSGSEVSRQDSASNGELTLPATCTTLRCVVTQGMSSLSVVLDLATHLYPGVTNVHVREGSKPPEVAFRLRWEPREGRVLRREIVNDVTISAE